MTALALATLCGAVQAAPAGLAPSPLNEVILEQIKKMPTGGKYSASRTATVRLQSAVRFESGKFFILPAAASPSYCSGATYLVFLNAIEALRDRGDLRLSEQALDRLMIRGQRDGAGIWGRWNANGPGTARLFYELGLGPNFDDFEEAQPGDFMKIFWSPEVGRAEHGHSVIYLGTEKKLGLDYVRYWSSNIPLGYGERASLAPKSPTPFFPDSPRRRTFPGSRQFLNSTRIWRAWSGSDPATQKLRKSAGCNIALTMSALSTATIVNGLVLGWSVAWPPGPYQRRDDAARAPAEWAGRRILAGLAARPRRLHGRFPLGVRRGRRCRRVTRLTATPSHARGDQLLASAFSRLQFRLRRLAGGSCASIRGRSAHASAVRFARLFSRLDSCPNESLERRFLVCRCRRTGRCSGAHQFPRFPHARGGGSFGRDRLDDCSLYGLETGRADFRPACLAGRTQALSALVMLVLAARLVWLWR